MAIEFARAWSDEGLDLYRVNVIRFIETEMLPNDARWREQHHVDRETWRKAGETGLLLLDVPTEYGGGGGWPRDVSCARQIAPCASASPARRENSSALTVPASASAQAR